MSNSVQDSKMLDRVIDMKEFRRSEAQRRIDETRRLIEKSKLLPERFRLKNIRNFDQIAEDVNEDSVAESISSDADNPLELSNIPKNEIKKRKKEAQAPLNQINRKNCRQQLVNDSFAVAENSVQESVASVVSGSHYSILTPWFEPSSEPGNGTNQLRSANSFGSSNMNIALKLSLKTRRSLDTQQF